MDTQDYEELKSWMCCEANRLLAHPRGETSHAYRAALSDIGGPHRWWAGLYPPDAASARQLDNAARALAHNKPLPCMPAAQVERLAFRLRLCSRLARTLGFREDFPPTGWLGERLRTLSREDFLEWALVDAWPLVLGVVDETLIWSDE
jgi:hypothetical protein